MSNRIVEKTTALYQPSKRKVLNTQKCINVIGWRYRTNNIEYKFIKKLILVHAEM